MRTAGVLPEEGGGAGEGTRWKTYKATWTRVSLCLYTLTFCSNKPLHRLLHYNTYSVFDFENSQLVSQLWLLPTQSGSSAPTYKLRERAYVQRRSLQDKGQTQA